MNFNELQIDILEDSADSFNDRWYYFCADGGKILIAPRKPTMLAVLPHDECKLVLEKVADRYEAMEGWYKRTIAPEKLEKYKNLQILGIVTPHIQQTPMYKLTDEGRNFYVYISPQWLKYINLLDVEVLAMDGESPVIIKEKDEIVQIVAPIKFDANWGL